MSPYLQPSVSPPEKWCENLLHAVGCCEVKRRSCRSGDFPPFCRKSVQERASNSGPDRHMQPHPAYKSRSPSFPPSPFSLPGFSPEGPRAPRKTAKPQDAEIGCEAPFPFAPFIFCTAVMFGAPSWEGKTPWLPSLLCQHL